MDAPRYRQNRRLPASVIGGEAAVVTPADSRLHILNDVGTRIWEMCDCEDGLSIEDLVARLIGEFDVTREVAERETEAFLQQSLGAGILERV